MRRTGELYAQRWSSPGVRYFVTICTHERRGGLEVPPVTEAIIRSAIQSDMQRDTETIALVVMPDHLHWLFGLGGRLQLGRVVAKLKAATRGMLTSTGLAWQRDFFEHRLRANDSLEDYGLYVFLNPYRARLNPANAVWRGWCCPRPELLRFVSRLSPDGSPPPEWIVEPVPEGLAVGE